MIHHIVRYQERTLHQFNAPAKNSSVLEKTSISGIRRKSANGVDHSCTTNLLPVDDIVAENLFEMRQNLLQMGVVRRIR